jgi:hypothetical protein
MSPIKSSFLGIAVSIAAWVIITLLIEAIIKFFGNAVFSSGGDSKMFEAAMITGLGIIPLSFFIGGMVTGFCSYYDIEYKTWFIFMAPAFYISILWMISFGIVLLCDTFKPAQDPSRTPLGIGLLLAFVIPFFWYLISLAGVFFGYYLRDRWAKWRHGY